MENIKYFSYKKLQFLQLKKKKKTEKKKKKKKKNCIFHGHFFIMLTYEESLVYFSTLLHIVNLVDFLHSI